MFVSGNLALDLAGTLKWRRDRPEELLTSPSDLDTWFVAARVVDVAERSTPADLALARTLREAVYATARAHLLQQPPAGADLDEINTCAAAPPVVVTLSADGARRTGSGTAALSSVARSLAEVIEQDPGILKECGRPACTRLFIDHSRGVRRVWCGMDECGSRVKMAAYRSRLQQEKAASTTTRARAE